MLFHLDPRLVHQLLLVQLFCLVMPVVVIQRGDEYSPASSPTIPAVKAPVIEEWSDVELDEGRKVVVSVGLNLIMG